MNTETLATTGQTPTEPAQQQPAATTDPATTPVADGQATAQQQQTTAQDPAATTTQADGQPTTDKGDGKPEGKTEVPAEYQDFSAPEGVKLDTELVGDFKALAKDLGLGQEKAQEVVDLGVKLQQKWQTEQAQAIESAKTQWAEQSNSDKEFGGEKIAENLAVAKKALDTFGTDDLKQLLNDSGLGNHPEIIRAFYRAGKAISEDRFVGGGNGPSGSLDPAKVLFPTMN